MDRSSAKSTNCPNCGFSGGSNGPLAAECPQCGIVFAKVRALGETGKDSFAQESTRQAPRTDTSSASGPTRFTLLPWLVAMTAVVVVAAGFNSARQSDLDSDETQATISKPPPVQQVPPTSKIARPVAPMNDPIPAPDEAWTAAEQPESLPVPAPEPQRAAIPSYTWYEGANGFLTGLEEAQQEGMAMAVYFYTDWCPYCRELEGELLTRARVEEFLKYLVKVRINPEHGPRERAIANEYGVRGYPSFFIQSSAAARPRKMSRTSGNRLKSPEEFVASLAKAAR
jgi:thiol-disulfide isomerase/thioredoxin